MALDDYSGTIVTHAVGTVVIHGNSYEGCVVLRSRDAVNLSFFVYYKHLIRFCTSLWSVRRVILE